MSIAYARRVLNQVDRPVNPPLVPIQKPPPPPVDWSPSIPSGEVYYEEPYTSNQITNACRRLERRIEQQDQARMRLHPKGSIPLRREVLEAFRPKLPGRSMKFRTP